jgi:glycosyltransferase involved in cell wall biosynthesis
LTQLAPMQATASPRAALSPLYLYVPSFDGGGAERVYIRLANHFAERGHETSFIVNAGVGPLRGLLSAKVTIIDLNAPRNYQAIPKLAAFLRREKPAVLLTALTGTNLAAIVARSLAGVRTRLVISERNQVTSRMNHYSPRHRWFRKKLMQLLYPRADGITAVTEGVASDLAAVARIREDRIDVVHNPGPDMAEILAAKAAPAPHPWFEGSDPVIVAIGRLVPQKGFMVLLEAVAKAQAHRKIKLIVLGEGPQLAELKAAAQRLGLSDTVEFHGFVLNRLDFLTKASLYVMSSDVEGFPNSLVEALACDVRVVTTDFAGGGARTILGHDHKDAIVPVGNPQRMAEAILSELDRPVGAGEMAAYARRFSIDSTAAKFLTLMVPGS